MVDQAILAFVHELDRVFDRDDVVAAVFIRVVHHGGEGRRFAGARRAGHHDQAPCSMENFFSTAGRGASNFSKSSNESTLLGIWRKTAAMPFFWLKKLARKREMSGIS